jgi:DNA-binding MarR family transcriptional regulator
MATLPIVGREVPKRSELVADELRQVVGAFMRRLRTESAAHELSQSEQVVMRRLHELGPLTTADLARAEMVKPQSMGATLAGLEEGGLVVRTTDPTDARCRRVSLTDRGKRVLAESRAARQNWLARAIEETLDTDEQRALFAATELLRRVVDS